MPASVGPARGTFVGAQRVAGDAGLEHLCARVALVGSKRVGRPAHGYLAQVLSGQGIPLADQTIGAAGEQRAIIGQECDRPSRQAGPDERLLELAMRALYDCDGAADARSGD